MPTFLPYESFPRSAEALDNKRLGKQRVETFQIMKALLNGGGWAHHPAVKMWRGYEHVLLAYQEAVCFEWAQERRYFDTCYDKTARLYFESPIFHLDNSLPPWLGDEVFHLSHQSNLVRKNPDYYGPKFLGVPPDLPYIWPV